MSMSKTPWALRRNDPNRMQTVLYTLAQRLLPSSRIPRAAFCRRRRRCSTSSRYLRTPATFRSLKRPLPPGRRCRRRARIFRALSTARRRPGEGRGMLVDGHCHLDFPAFAEERDSIIGAPAPVVSLLC